MSTDLKQKARQLAMQAGLNYGQADRAADSFVEEINQHIEEQKAHVEVKVHSVDKKAGEVIIRVHETSSREPAEILDDVLERYKKDPDKWSIVSKVGNTTGGYTAYVGKPKKQPTKKKSQSSSKKKKTQTTEQSVQDRFDQLSDDRKKEVLQKLLQKQDEEEMDL